MPSFFVSICILSYNRPITLLRLLQTIEINTISDFEIVISDDCSPKKVEINNVIKQFSKKNKVSINFIQNNQNQGYDKNFNSLVKHAKGKWLIFMGDDDEFVPGSIQKLYSFLKKNDNLGYILKSHYLIHKDGSKELFKYFKDTKFFASGESALLNLFRKSVYIAGFIIKRKLVLNHLTDRFDGSMLNQLYLMSEVILKNKSAYFNLPITQQYESLSHNDNDVMYDREKKVFIPRKPTLEISVNFLNSFSLITKYIDLKYNLNTTSKIKNDMSKYLYPSLAIHRKAGLKIFYNYVKELNKIGFNSTIYYYLYIIALTIFKKRFCDFVIRLIKKLLGFTPQL